VVNLLGLLRLSVHIIGLLLLLLEKLQLLLDSLLMSRVVHVESLYSLFELLKFEFKYQRFK
jgi:Gpi18-like mannosyltransferase